MTLKTRKSSQSMCVKRKCRNVYVNSTSKQSEFTISIRWFCGIANIAHAVILFCCLLWLLLFFFPNSITANNFVVIVLDAVCFFRSIVFNRFWLLLVLQYGFGSGKVLGLIRRKRSASNCFARMNSNQWIFLSFTLNLCKLNLVLERRDAKHWY